MNDTLSLLIVVMLVDLKMCVGCSVLFVHGLESGHRYRCPF
jgi:hypothetical protein